MSNTLNPAAVIFINSDIALSVVAQLHQQMAITEVIDAGEFDDRLSSDPLYPQRIHGLGERILVLRDLHDFTNRDAADFVLCFKNGLVYLEQTKHGPPGKALSLQDVYLHALIT